MKRTLLALIFLLISTILVSPGSNAGTTVKDGARCTKLNQKVTVNKKIYQCRKSGRFLVWRSVSSATTSVTYPPTGLPAGRLLASSPGLLGLVDKTADAVSWAQYYGRGLAFKDGYIRQGSTFTLKWHVVNALGKPLPNQAVTLCVNKGWGGSTATFTSGGKSIANTGNGTDGADLRGTTDTSGNVSFTLTDTSRISEPYDVATNMRDIYPLHVYGQFGLLIGSTPQSATSMDIIEVHILSAVYVSPTPIPSGSPLWAQDFNEASGTSPSSSVWTPLIGDGYDQLGFYNYGTGEIEMNSASAAKTDGTGNLVITAKKQNGTWTSARIWTQGKVNFQYGRLEARMKFPVGSFNWPAFWMLGSNYQPPNNYFGDTPWPNSGEIDIAEGLGGNSVNRSTLHGNNPGTYRDWNNGGGVSLLSPLSDLSSSFHTFGMLWKPNVLAFTIDGVEFGRNTLVGNNIIQTVQGVELGRFNSGGVWPFNKPFMLLLDNAITPDSANLPDGTSSKMLIDWIHYSTYEGYGSINP